MYIVSAIFKKKNKIFISDIFFKLPLFILQVFFIFQFFLILFGREKIVYFFDCVNNVFLHFLMFNCSFFAIFSFFFLLFSKKNNCLHVFEHVLTFEFLDIYIYIFQRFLKFVHQEAKAFNTPLYMTLHVVSPSYRVVLGVIVELGTRAG